MAILTGGYSMQDVISLSPRLDFDYAKTKAGRSRALQDFLNDKQFILGVHWPVGQHQVVTRSRILKTMREQGRTKAQVIIYSHSKSEILRVDLECTYEEK